MDELTDEWFDDERVDRRMSWLMDELTDGRVDCWTS